MTPEEVAWWVVPGIHLGVVLATGGMAAMLLLSDPRRNWNRILALFLVCVSLNFLAQTIEALAGRQPRYGWSLISPAASAAWARIGAITFIIDVAALAYFVSIFPRRTALARHWLGPTLLGAVTLAFLAIEFSNALVSPAPGRTPAPGPRILFFLWAGGVYLFAVAWMARHYLAERSLIMGRQVRIVAAALMVALVPRVALMPRELDRYWSGGLAATTRNAISFVLFLVLLWGPYLALLLGARRHSRRLPQERARRVRVTLVAVAAAFAFLTAYMAAYFLAKAAPAGTVWAVQSGREAGLDMAAWYYLVQNPGTVYGLRWIAFSALVFYGIVRYQVLAVRQTAFRTAVAGALLLAVAAAGAVLAQLQGPWIGGPLASLAGAAVAVLAYHHLRLRRTRPMDAYLRARAIDAYRSAIAAALVDGALPPESAQRLAGLRKQLGIGAREHDTLLHIAQVEQVRTARRRLLGRYEVVRRLGTGAYASVDLVRDPKDGALLAVKTHRGATAAAKGDVPVLREGTTTQRVSHPHLLAIHAVTAIPGGVAVVQEYAPGGSLRAFLQSAGTLTPAETRRILRQTLHGLQALHEAGIVHGDLKPENILLDGKGAVKLADFGSSGQDPAAPGGTAPHATMVGPETARYEPPEATAGAPPTARNDLYAAALIALEALTGRVGDARIRLSAEAVPQEWRAFLAQALHADPAQRFASAAAMQDALARLGAPARRRPWALSGLLRLRAEPA